LTAALILVPGIASLAWYARGSQLTLTLICCTIARLWSYHRFYDNLMLMFLVLGLAVRARETRSALLWGCFFLTGLTLWPPPRLFTVEINLIANFIWIGSAAAYCTLTPVRHVSRVVRPSSSLA
jgi:hypothetical protein